MPITYDLLRLVAKEYGRDMEIRPDARVWDDKRLDGSAFSRRTGYTPQPWEDLIALIHADQTVWEKTMQR